MAEIVCTPAQIGMVDPEKCRIKSYLAGEAIIAGQFVYQIAATGRLGVADANAAGKQQCVGMALNGAAAGFAVEVLEDGEVYGFTLAGNYGTIMYLSDTAGVAADAAGTMTVVVGRVAAMTDRAATKVARILTSMNAINWA